ncbi:MAG: amino acid-binding ACT domain-containing protein [Gemmatimonadota bacterium]|nr:amino acid-binding ACT domain-containing protein [Gemmatimonadota bacterium]
MKDLAIALENRPGALADLGEALGKAGVSVEGGGAWLFDRKAIAHFLFKDGSAARKALEAAGIKVIAERDVVSLRLKQEVPGQLGKIARRMGEAGVNIEAQYSDHINHLILVVDDIAKARIVSEKWLKDPG